MFLEGVITLAVLLAGAAAASKPAAQATGEEDEGELLAEEPETILGSHAARLLTAAWSPRENYLAAAAGDHLLFWPVFMNR